MTKENFKPIIHFAEINGMMKWTFEDVLNEYLTTKEVADSYENFSYFDKPINEVNDLDLISWYIMFLNGADYSDPQFRMEYDMFHEECKRRDKEFNMSIDYLDSIL